MNYAIYVADVETTGLDPYNNDVIELSLLRLSDGEQKTWCMKPLNFQTIETAALKINGHKLEDITHVTKYGQDTYLDPAKVIVDIENWVLNDDASTNNRVLCGQNIAFDKNMLEQLWTKCNSKDTMPFGRRTLDTMTIEFFLDLCKGEMALGYSLSNLTKKYGVTNSKAHSAASDVLATKEVFEHQISFFKKLLKNND